MPIPQLTPKIEENDPMGKMSTPKAKKGFKRYLKSLLTKEKLRSLAGVATLVAAMLAVAGAIAGAVVFIWLSRTLPDPNNISTREVAQSTKIYDRSGEHLLYEIHGEEKRTVIDLSDIPEKVREATIAIEDKEFYKHRGFRITSLIRAVIANALAGRKVQGGSTITQQLVKNAILTNQKAYARKIKELVLSYEIERRFSKDEILKLYFNEIPYGSSAYGIEAAAETYFGKSAKDLTLTEGAMLAAVANAPTYYSPYGSHTDDLRDRVKLVLDRMTEEGFVTKEEAEAAKSEDVVATVKPKREAIEAPHFVMYVKEMLTDKFGERTVETGGLKVYTTLDWDKQKAAERAIDDGIAKVEAMGGSNAALVSLDPKTGDILAMVGSRDYFDTEHDGNVNVTTRLRQPGSSFKPIVYAASFEKGYTPNTVLYDVDTVFKSANAYHPRNYDLTEHGPVTIRKALAGSLNIPAVKTMYLTGVSNVLDFADRLGYTSFGDRSRFGLAIVLGGGEVRPIEHAAAFATFAAGGTYRSPRSLIKVEGPDGKVLDEWKPDEGRSVMDPEIARNIADVMSDNDARAYVFGTKNYLTLPGRPVAAKTGTTNDFHDAWTVGFTPQLATVVWTGNNDNAEMKRGADGSVVAAPIWNQYMREALKDAPVEGFTKPQPIATGKPVLDGATEATSTIRIDRATGKLATDLTPPSFVVDHVISLAHCILEYVQKDDPRGDPPADPNSDPEYAGWEASVQDWVTRNSTSTTYENFTPPTESDDVHVEANRPTVSIAMPYGGATVSERSISVAANAYSLRGVRRVEWYLDGSLFGVSHSEPWTGTFKIPNRINVGYHTLEARAFDDVDNMGKSEIQVNVTAQPDGVPVTWATPTQGTSLRRDAFPIAISASIGNAAGVKRADIVIVGTGGGYRHTPGSFANPGTSELTAKWMLPPAAGTYDIRMELEMDDGSRTVLPDQIEVYVQ